MLQAIGLGFAWLGIFAALLFGCAGRLDWPMAWALLAVQVVFGVVGFLLLDPDLIRERARPTPGFDRGDAALAGSAFVLLCLIPLAVAGLGLRFGTAPAFPLALRVAALALCALGQGFSLWAAVRNPFFSDFVRIQTERGHHVVASGPYAWVRHPGYAGAIPAFLAVPVALGSLWALAAALLGSALLAIRAAREDRILHAKLDGYPAYAARVRFRLLPGLW